MATHCNIFCLENPTDRGALWATVSEVAQSQTQLSDLAAAVGEFEIGTIYVLFMAYFLIEQPLYKYFY